MRTSKIIRLIKSIPNRSSNRLQKVTDLAPPLGGSGGLGDFKDSTNTGDDYSYDANGNIVQDNNRHLHNANGSIGTLFNLLDKPDSMAIAGRSCTYYKYDAAGILLTKTVNDYKNNTIKNYSYVSGFVYMNDTLQYAGMEEGRMRRCSLPKGGLGWAFDYFIKDHAGNIRTVITDERKMDIYPFATMDTITSIKMDVNKFYAGLDLTRVVKPAGYPAADIFTVPNTNDYVAKVQAVAGSQKIGPSLTLKVMKGDSINIRVSSWYKLNNVTPTVPAPNTSLANIVSSLISGISGSAIVNTHGVTGTAFTTANSFTPDVTTFLNNQTTNNYNTTKPKAYLNWIYFDEQFNIVSSSSSAEQVGADQELKPHVQQTVASKCGFLYVYVSNETPDIPVYFDNLQVSHIRSPLLETNEYYPYGLKMASISYKAASTLTNRYGWNGGNEYEDEGELNYSNTFYRKYDAQIGRFTGIDMLAEEFADLTPYQFGGNNPVMFNDPTGARITSDVDSRNPASFSSADLLLNYIINYGIGGFDDQFNNWTFGGGGETTGYASGNNVEQFSRNGESYVKFTWSGEGRYGAKGKFGESSTLKTVVMGVTTMKVQTLWNHALGWGERNRDASIKLYGATEHYDVMDAHNYGAFRERLSGNKPLSRSGDRKSYTENLERFKGRYAREQDARNFEMGFVGVFTAPLAIYGLAEAGVVGLTTQAYSSLSTSITSLETIAAYVINIGKNGLVSAIGNAAIGYTSGGIGTFYISSQVIPGLMNSGYSAVIGNPTMFAAIWQAAKFAQGNLNGMQNPLIKP